MSSVPNERMAEHFADYRFSYFYGIQRSKHLSVALNAVAAATDYPEFIEYPNGSAGYELGMEICGAALGRLGNSPDVLLLKRIGNESPEAEHQQSNEWFEDPNAQAAVQAWRSILSQHLAPHLGVSEVTVNGWIAEATKLFCHRETVKKRERPKTTALVSAFARALKPKSNKAGAPKAKASTRLVNNTQAFVFQALRYTYRACMKVVGRPGPERATISGLDRVDQRDLQDVLEILDR